ncbi:MAG: rod shape-determining protein [Candidatus Berkelbacteria bacterium]
MVRKIALDLGTNNIRIFVPKKGIVVSDPSVVALESSTQQIMAIGEEAKKMIGRTPDSIIAATPLLDGAIANFRITEAIIRYYVNKVLGNFRLFKPDIMVTIPAGLTSTERRAVIDACNAAGAKQTFLIKQPIAAALGAGVPIAAPSGNMIIDIGGGTSEVAVISLGDVVASTSVRIGGNKFNIAIANYIRKKHNLIIGDQTAENIKIKIGSAQSLTKEEKMEVSGSNTISGLPESVMVTSEEITHSIKQPLLDIINAVKDVLQKTPPELASDVMDKGIVLTGGGAQLRHIDSLLTKVTGVPCEIANNPTECVVKGAGIAIENLESFKRSVLWSKD